MCQSLLAVETKRLETAVTQHLEHLGVFLAFFFEDQFALFVVVLVLAAAPVFASLVFTMLVERRRRADSGWGWLLHSYLSLILGHVECGL